MQDENSNLNYKKALKPYINTYYLVQFFISMKGK
jgi:hypothetical protein